MKSKTVLLKMLLTSSVWILFFGVYVALVHADNISLDLQIPLPGLGGKLTVCSGTGDALKCSGLADYTIKFYTWAIAAAAIFALAVLTYGGIRWLLAGGNNAHADDAKKVITNALAGLVLVLGSHLLLYTINPKLVKLEVLELANIKGRPLETAAVSRLPSGGVLPAPDLGPCDSAITLPAGASVSITKTSVLPFESLTQAPCAEPEDFMSEKRGGRIAYTPVTGGKCAPPAANSGEWDSGVTGDKKIYVSGEGVSGLASPVDKRILGVLAELARECGDVKITAFNERCGHPGQGHSAGLAVDVSDTLCGASIAACGGKQKKIMETLNHLGYKTGAKGGACGATFSESSAHLHIEIGPSMPSRSPPLISTK